MLVEIIQVVAIDYFRRIFRSGGLIHPMWA